MVSIILYVYRLEAYSRGINDFVKSMKTYPIEVTNILLTD